MLAHERLELLKARAAPSVLAGAADALARMAKAGGWSLGPGVDVYDDAVADVIREGSMAPQLLRSYAALKNRIADAVVRKRMDAIEGSLAIGATTDGEVAAAVFAYEDDSYLLVVDQSLMVLSWLIAQMAALMLDPRQFGLRDAPVDIDPEDAAAAVRLGVARPAVGARAGLAPAFVVSEARLTIAGALVGEIDLLLLGHEIAHVLLGHFHGRRRALGAIAGSAVLADNAIALELDADLLAATFLFDDFAEGHPRASAVLRIGAMRLLFSLIELYERACFVLQPGSHPSAATRFAHLERVALRRWFGESLPEFLEPFEGLVTALRTSEPLVHAVARVEHGLDRYLDRALWDQRTWADVAQLGSLVFPPPAAARRALTAALRTDEHAAEVVARVLANRNVLELLAAKREDVLKRLEFLDAVAAALDEIAHDDVPVWAVSALAAAALPRVLASPLS